ncbi:MAG: hypothetical protein ACRD5M_02730 [Candidatus Acidiferrales bacterium]
MTDHNNRSLGNGIELVREDIFYPEGNWSIRLGDLTWSKREGWRKYYEALKADCYFRSAQEGLKAWESLGLGYAKP